MLGAVELLGVIWGSSGMNVIGHMPHMRSMFQEGHEDAGNSELTRYQIQLSGGRGDSGELPSVHDENDTNPPRSDGKQEVS